MTRIILAKFNRDFHTHERFKDQFINAFDSFVNDVKQWQEHTGIKFECAIESCYDHNLHQDVTIVCGKFENAEDYAFYKLFQPNHQIATNLSLYENSAEFSRWIVPKEPWVL